MLPCFLAASAVSLMQPITPRPPSGFVWSEVPAYGFASMSENNAPKGASTPPPVAKTAVEAPAKAAPVVSAQLDKAEAVGKVVPTKAAEPAKPKPKKAARKPSPTGIFAPLVLGTKRIMGEKELNKLRAEVIAQHTKVITAFVDTSESKFGQIVLRQMFEAADKDNNGTLDREEIREALHALGFSFIADKQLNQIMDRADIDQNEVIDFEEFVRETPKTLRSSLIKLAKQNGHDLGFLA